MDNSYNNTTADHSSAATFTENYRPNEEELKLLAQCRVESNMKGGTGALLAGGLAYQSVKSFNLKVSPKFGVYPKVGVACTIGFLLGKLMAIPSCYEKFKNHPNSPLGTYLRQKKAGYGESLPVELAPDANSSFPVAAPLKYADGGQMNSAIDIDVYNSPSSTDSYTGNELNDPTLGTSTPALPDQGYVEKPSVSYAELRRRNRDEHSRADKEKYNSARSVVSDNPAGQPTRRSSPLLPVEEKNKYGDVWG